MRFRFFPVLLVLLSVLMVPVSAVEGDVVEDFSQAPADDSSSSDAFVGDVIVDVPEYTAENPLPVEVVPPDEEALPDYDNSGVSSNSLLPDVDADFPNSPLFSGCWFVTGTDSRLGTITIYIPADVDQSSFGVDSSGRLVYVGSDSFTAYLSGVRNNRVNFSSWSTGTYSDGSGSYYDSYDLSLVPSSTNLLISDSLIPLYSVSDFLPYLVLLIGGVLLLCFMKR